MGADVRPLGLAELERRQAVAVQRDVDVGGVGVEALADHQDRLAVGVLARRPRVGPEDPRCGEDGGDREPDQCAGDHRDDGVDPVVVVVLEPVDEYRHQRRRENPAEDEVVHDVRGRVGEVVAVGQHETPEGVGHHDGADDSGHAAQCGADADDRGTADDRGFAHAGPGAALSASSRP